MLFLYTILPTSLGENYSKFNLLAKFEFRGNVSGEDKKKNINK